MDGNTSKSSRTRLTQQAFLAAFLENNGNVTHASAAVGIAPKTFYQWRKHDADFVQQLEEVDQAFADRLEETARTFAFQGDTTLLIFLLKSLRRTKYDDHVARIKWQTDNQIVDPNAQQPTQIVFMRETSPDDEEADPYVPTPDEAN